jgi:short-subunit dehydrogenase involved in D-alanine esterification of teichoic acids
MKIGITGTTRGLGKALSDRLCGKWNVQHFNRPEYNICCPKCIGKLSERIKEPGYRVFINNAHEPFCQTDVLTALFNAWSNDPNKIIININSRAKYPNLSKGYVYSASKASLSHLSDSLKFTTPKKCRIMDINLGLLESDLPSLTYDEAAKMITNFINMMQHEKHFEIGSVDLYHSAPYVEVQKQKQIKLNESRKNMGKN